MAKDELLQSTLAACAAASGGRIKFTSRTLQELGTELGIDLRKSPHSVYDFTVVPPVGDKFRCIAYKNVVNAAARPATRVEALGRSLAVEDGKLFALNPLLLVFDYMGKQFMAVSAITLFGAFARELASRPRPKAETSTFSMTPNFQNRTISMYADLAGGSIWHSTLDSTLTADALITGLTKIRDETVAQASQIPSIVKAIEARLADDTPAASSTATIATVPVPDSPEPTIQVDERVRRMVRTAIRSAQAVILVGPPGTGKTALLREIFREVARDPAAFGLSVFGSPLWATPDESWTVRELVGGETIVGDAIQFRPGWVLQSVAQNKWLVLDEVNRADMDRIFGGLLTWLSGGTVTLGVASTAPGAPHIELGWNGGQADCATVGIDVQGEYVGVAGKVRYSAGEGWRLLGTYNALDAQRVFRFGAALGRRFVRVPIPAPHPTLFATALAEQAKNLPSTMRDGIVGLYAAHFETEATQLGPAIFLAMCNYLRVAAASQSAIENSAANDTETEVSVTAELTKAFPEAYVVHVGTWLAHLDPRDRDALGERVVGRVILTPDEWSWVKKMIQSLA